jgi:hypothetical protein
MAVPDPDRTKPETGGEGRVAPAFSREDGGRLRHLEYRQFQTFFPNNWQTGAVDVGKRADADILLGAAEAEGFGQRRFAFQDQHCAFFDARRPFRRCGRAATGDEDVRETRRLALETDGLKNLRPGAGILGKDREVRERAQGLSPDLRHEDQQQRRKNPRPLPNGRGSEWTLRSRDR